MLVIRTRTQRSAGIEISISPTKESPYYGLLYREVVAGIRTLLRHIQLEGLWYEMEFNLYHTVTAGRLWKMAGKLGREESGDVSRMRG